MSTANIKRSLLPAKFRDKFAKVFYRTDLPICKNKLTISGPKASIRAFADFAATTFSPFDFFVFVPPDEDIRDAINEGSITAPPTSKQSGLFWWLHHNWGSWGAAERVEIHERPDRLIYAFDTMDSGPILVVEEASLQFPDLEFSLSSLNLDSREARVFIVQGGVVKETHSAEYLNDEQLARITLQPDATTTFDWVLSN